MQDRFSIKSAKQIHLRSSDFTENMINLSFIITTMEQIVDLGINIRSIFISNLVPFIKIFVALLHNISLKNLIHLLL